MNGYHSDGMFNLHIPRNQFNDKTATFKLVFRNNDHIQGPSFFKDIYDQTILGRNTAIVSIVVVTSPAEGPVRHNASAYGISIIHTSELLAFAESLARIKRGQDPNYKGLCEIIRNEFALFGKARFDISGLENLARDAEALGNWEEANNYWRSLVKLDKNRWQSYFSLGQCLRAQGMLADAEIARREALLLAPDQPQILAESARIAEQQGNYQGALRIWEDVIRCFPGSWEGYRGLSYALVAIGRDIEAGQFVEKHALTFPLEPSATLDVARFAEIRKDWVKAEQAWVAFRSFDNKSTWVYTRLCNALREQGKFEEAKLVAYDALLLFPADIDIAEEAEKCAELVKNHKCGRGNVDKKIV